MKIRILFVLVIFTFIFNNDTNAQRSKILLKLAKEGIEMTTKIVKTSKPVTKVAVRSNRVCPPSYNEESTKSNSTTTWSNNVYSTNTRTSTPTTNTRSNTQPANVTEYFARKRGN